MTDRLPARFTYTVVASGLHDTESVASMTAPVRATLDGLDVVGKHLVSRPDTTGGGCAAGGR